MAIVDCRPLAPPSARSLHTLTVGKLGAVVNRDRLEHGVKLISEFLFQAVECLYYVRGLAGGHLDRDLLAGRALRELKYPGEGAFLALDGVTLPMSGFLPTVRRRGPLFYAQPWTGAGGAAHFLMFPFFVPLDLCL